MAHRIAIPVQLSLIALMIAFGTDSAVSAPPRVAQIDPPVLRRGATTRVTLRGSDVGQAVGAWLSVPMNAPAVVKVEPGGSSDEVTLSVQLPADAPLGMHGLRLATRSGLSNVHLLLIDELPVTRIGDQPMQTAPIKVELPCCLSASCRPATVDRYAIEVTAGQRIAFEVVGSRFGKDYDPVVTIRDEAGQIVARRDNDPGLFYDCRFSHTFAQSGRAIVEVQDARFEGRPTWNYILRMGDFPAANVVIPSAGRPGTTLTTWLPEVPDQRATVTVTNRPRTRGFFGEIRTAPSRPATWVPLKTISVDAQKIETEPNEDPDETATLAVVPGTLNGVLGRRGDQDCFAFHMTKGQAFDFVGVSREMGSAADLELVMFVPDDRVVRRIDDVNVRIGRVTRALEAHFTYQAGKDGMHWLMVRDVAGDGGPTFAYRIEVTEQRPELTMSAEVSRLTVPQGSWQPVPITVNRQRIAGPISLELIGVPKGVSIEPSTIPADVNEVVCRVSATSGTVLGLSTLEIVGHCKSADGKAEAEGIVTFQPLIDQQLINKDLIPYALRDNQIHLPPSLETRLALIVTPPAPFTVEVPSKELVMAKYQSASFPIVTSRVTGLGKPIVFAAQGGQIGDEAVERSNVYVRIPNATVDQPKVEGTFRNRINTQYTKARVDLSASVSLDGYEVTLFRTFDLDVRSAFKPTFEPATVTVEPGSMAKIKVLANRTTNYNGEVVVTPTSDVPGIKLPETIVIPSGRDHVELDVPISAELVPRRYSIRCQSAGYVGKYEESLNEPNFTFDIKAPPVAKSPPK
ncbi:MAG: hypothetical protein O3A00_28240 [Planctomycetota bacterium]|nr:hypothetical protein [Planctomycetota bacterium]